MQDRSNVGGNGTQKDVINGGMLVRVYSKFRGK